MERYDIVIVGGGLAGLSTALSICREADATVLIVEKGEIGDQQKTSPFTFPDVVKRYDLCDAVLQEYTRFTYKSPTGISASFVYENPAFVTVDYQKMCSALVKSAKEEGNLSVLEKVAALNLNANAPFFLATDLKLTLSDSSRISCGVMVDASGSSFFAARKLGIKLPLLYSHPYGELLDDCEIADPEEMCIFTGNKYGNGGGWFYPIGKKTARFGFAAITRSRIYPKGVVENNFRKATRDFKPYNEMLARGKSKRSEFGTIPIGALDKIVSGRVLIVGDAAGQATPWYNEGVRPALENGEMCGKTIVEAYENGEIRRKTLMKYQHQWAAKYKQPYEYARVCAAGYFRSQEQWENSVRYQASFTPEEMMGVIRYCNFPKMRSKPFLSGARRPVDFLKQIISRGKQMVSGG